MRVWLVPLLMAFAVSSASAENIRVMAAGSLKDAFTAIFADYSKRYGGGFSPVWGPSGTLRERLQNGEAFDVFASAALPHAQTLTDAGISGPSVLFVRNALCIVTDAGRDAECRKPGRDAAQARDQDRDIDAGGRSFRRLYLGGVSQDRCAASRRLRYPVEKSPAVGRRSRRAGHRERTPPAAGRARRSRDRSVHQLLLGRRDNSPGNRRDTNRWICRRSLRRAPNTD